VPISMKEGIDAIQATYSKNKAARGVHAMVRPPYQSLDAPNRRL